MQCMQNQNIVTKQVLLREVLENLLPKTQTFRLTQMYLVILLYYILKCQLLKVYQKQQSLLIQINTEMQDPFISPKPQYRQDTLTIQQMLGKAGNSSKYQFKLLICSFLVFLFASFLQMGFPIIFQDARFECPVQPIPADYDLDQLNWESCPKEKACQADQIYRLADYPRSVARTYGLVCDKQRLLEICFSAFLWGGFMGSLYYGQVIERNGRRYALLSSMVMMTAGLYLSLIGGNIYIFAIGVFFFNAGFRGYFNASLLTLTEVMNEISRASTPMVLSIGWALGQIIIAMIGYFTPNWRINLFLTAVPLTVLLYYSYKITLQSPRFLTVKHQFTQAKETVAKIAFINQHQFSNYELKQQVEYKQKIEGYQKIVGQSGKIQQTLRHHSYLSLFRFNSIRVRVLIVSYIWVTISLSYYISANSQINPSRSTNFNIALAGVIQIIAYLGSMVTSLNYGRVYVIKRLLIFAGFVHITFYFIGPLNTYHGFGKFIVMTQSILVRVLMSVGNTFLAIYAIELFPTSIRHYALGMLGFITKLAYMLSYPFDKFWTERQIHPNFILGILFFGGYFLTPKLRETKQHEFKDNLSQDNDGTLMTQMRADIF